MQPSTGTVDAHLHVDKSAGTHGNPSKTHAPDCTRQRDAVSKFNRNQRVAVYWSARVDPGELRRIPCGRKMFRGHGSINPVDFIIQELQFRLVPPGRSSTSPYRSQSPRRRDTRNFPRRVSPSCVETTLLPINLCVSAKSERHVAKDRSVFSSILISVLYDLWILYREFLAAEGGNFC